MAIQKPPTMAELAAKGETPDVLFWVGCAGSFDDNAKKVTRSFVQILQNIGVRFAVLGTEESCTGDPAKRAGNEFLFQMQAFTNIEKLNAYNVKKIVTTCPHCFNTLKNDYPDLGGTYEVVHHTQFLKSLVDEGKLRIRDTMKDQKITFHDPCYLGRANGIYDAPRELIYALKADIVEMKNCKNRGLCCGAGGAQMFKEAEKGDKEINIARTEEALETQAKTILTGCPFCKTMLLDGIAAKTRKDIVVIDIAELIAENTVV